MNTPVIVLCISSFLAVLMTISIVRRIYFRRTHYAEYKRLILMIMYNAGVYPAEQEPPLLNNRIAHILLERYCLDSSHHLAISHLEIALDLMANDGLVESDEFTIDTHHDKPRIIHCLTQRGLTEALKLNLS